MIKNKHTKRDYLQQVSGAETAVILETLREVIKRGVDGDVVEFGCYRGDTSLLMQKVLTKEYASCSGEEEHDLWIYDSFEGLPAKTREDNSTAGDAFKAGELFVTKREVVERFKKAGLKIPRIRKGFFENLNEHDLPEKIAFAFLDGDLYQSIKTSLSLVVSRLTRDENGKISGIFIVHDYNNPQLPGVARAVDEWMRNYSETQKTTPHLQRRESLAIISF